MDTTVKTIDDFIAKYPVATQAILQQIRETIQKTVPEAKEKISYGIPTFTFHGNLVHFSAYEKHIGFYPGSVPIVAFAKELTPYETAKGTVRFPIDQPIPHDLIQKMTQYAVKRNLEKIK